MVESLNLGFAPATLALATTLVIMLDRSHRRWISFFTVVAALITGTVVLSAQKEELFFLFCCFQSGAIALGLARSDLRQGYKGWVSGILGIVLTTALFGSLAWTSPAEYYVCFYVLCLLLSFVPFVIESSKPENEATIWVMCVFQQTVLRVGVVYFFTRRPEGLILDTHLFSMPPLVLAGAAALSAIFFSRATYWERTRQIFLTLIVMAASVSSSEPASEVVLMLIGVGFGLGVVLESGRAQKSTFESLAQVLDGGGLGGLLFVLQMLLIFGLRQRITYPEIVGWVALVFFVGGMSWARATDADPHGPSRPDFEKRSRIRLAFHALAVLGLLSWAGFFGD